MKYPYMTLNDGTEITHSDIMDDSRVKIRIERPTQNGFDSMIWYLPDYQTESNTGFSDDVVTKFKTLLVNLNTQKFF